MNIHHTIVKLAATRGVILEAEADQISAHHAQTNTTIVLDGSECEDDQPAFNELARDALVICKDIADFKSIPENNVWEICQTDEGGYSATHLPTDTEIEPVESWDDLKAAIAEFEPEDEDESEDDDEAVATVVPAKYKLLYAEIGVEGQDNGDWLAAQMAALVLVHAGKTVTVDVDRVSALAWANGIERDYVEGNRGWQGRYRMTIGTLLRKKVADQGYLSVPVSLLAEGASEPEHRNAPQAFIERWATRPRKARKGKAAKAATEVVSAPAAPKAKASRKRAPKA